jgi:exosome complex component CSL4
VFLQEADPKQKQRPILTVGRSAIPGLSSSTGNGAGARWKFNTLPAVDSIILGRVTRVQKRQAALSILIVLDEAQSRDHQLTDEDLDALISSSTDPSSTPTNAADDMRFQALIRKEDVRAVEKDRVVMDEMFRVGDVVRASVISIGDQAAYYATTAKNELGVVIARSEAGNMMFPASWKEMRDPVTGLGELRKVAKPF